MAVGKSSKEASTHDRKVREIVRTLEKKGYAVRADVRGREQPRPIGAKKLVPDIDAKHNKTGHRQIVEVETPTSLVTDKEQIKTFVRHAARAKDTTFKIVVTKPRKV